MAQQAGQRCPNIFRCAVVTASAILGFFQFLYKCRLQCVGIGCGTDFIHYVTNNRLADINTGIEYVCVYICFESAHQNKT